jgi:hypothetical protein
MVVITTAEFNTKQKKYFDLAKRERVAIKRGKNHYVLMFDNELDNENQTDWIPLEEVKRQVHEHIDKIII